MPRSVALLLFLFLVGCSGATRGIRPGSGQETLRYTGRIENKSSLNGGSDSTIAAPAPVVLGAGLPAAPVASHPPMPLQGISGEGLGNGIPRAVLQLVPPGATTAAEAGTASATGEALVVGGAVFAAGGSVVLVCLTVKAAMDGMETPIDIADTFYGTHFGDIQGWVRGCYAPRATVSRAPPARTPPAPLPELETGGDRGKKSLGRLYATYTKFNPGSSRHYVGRTSMVVDLHKPLRRQAEQAVDARDSNHHIDESDEPKMPGFRQAVLDEFDVGTALDYANRYSDIAYWRIRGREQQLMDFFGGAQSDTRAPYRTENVNRGVAKDNPLGRLFHDAASKKWGQLYPYTGD